MSTVLKAKILDSAIMNGVSVVTSSFKGTNAGCAVSWFAQVSYSPVLIMVSISPARHTYAIIKKSSLFNVNILAKEQLDLGRHFGLTSGHTTNKFDNLTFTTGKNGAPVLSDLKALAECTLVETYKAGDHDLFIGEVTNFTENRAKEPLHFVGTDYWG